MPTAEQLELLIFKDPFQPKLFYDFMKTSQHLISRNLHHFGEKR